MNISEKRDRYMDISKGIGVILVVFGHTFPIYLVTSYVYSFHMPLFFLLAGCTFDVQKNMEDPWRFSRRYFFRLAMPYLVAAVCSYLIYRHLAPILSLPDITVSAAAHGIFIGNGNNLAFNNILSFLPAFFFGGLIFLSLAFLFKGIRLFFASAIVSFAGIITGLSHPLSFGLDIAMTAQFFIYCGHLFREADWLEKIRTSGKNGILFSIALLSLIVTLVFSSMNGRIDMMSRIYGQPVLFFICGLSGSVLILMVSLSLSVKNRCYHYFGRILETSGRASMCIFISHIPVVYCLASTFTLIWGLWIYHTFEIYWYILFIAGVSIPVLAHRLVGPFIKIMPDNDHL